jgi:hypothetical protein
MYFADGVQIDPLEELTELDGENAKLTERLAAAEADLTECRRLLRDACDECHVVKGVLVKGLLTHQHSYDGGRLSKEWFGEAAKAGGGE